MPKLNIFYCIFTVGLATSNYIIYLSIVNLSSYATTELSELLTSSRMPSNSCEKVYERSG